MTDARLAFHAHFPAGPTDADVAAAHDAAAATVGMVLRGVERSLSGTTRSYGEPGAAALGFSYTLEPPCQLAMFSLHPDAVQSYAPVRVASMFTRVCEALDADIARSDFGSGYGLVQESELTGAVEFVDWYQYFGPRVVERIGLERLLDAPAFQVSETDRGGIVMLLASDPFSGHVSRTPIADHLGIKLRPLQARNPQTGEPIVIPWL